MNHPFNTLKIVIKLLPMKEYNLVYDPDDSDEMMLFSNLNIQKLAPPVSIMREDPVQEEEQPYSKKKSELVDFEDEEYCALREMEQIPWNVIDSESRTFSGKFQDMESHGASMYFALINMGTHLKMIPISKWYGFVQKNIFAEGDGEALEKTLNQFEYFEEESDASVDNAADFDDDDGEEFSVYVEKEKKLTNSGKQLQGLVENYQEDLKTKVEANEEEEVEEEEEEDTSKKHKVNKTLTKADIQKIFGSGSISVRDLLKIIKLDFKLDDSEKTLIREFIHENCTFETDKSSGEKMFKLKK